MFSIFIIPVVFFGVLLYNCVKRPRVKVLIQRGYTHDNIVFINDNSLIIDAEKHNVDYIIARFLFNNEEYKIIVEDYFDLNGIKKYKHPKLLSARLKSESNDIDNDVTNFILKYAGPNHDFYNIDQDFKLIFHPSWESDNSDDWCLVLTYENDYINQIFL